MSIIVTDELDDIKVYQNLGNLESTLPLENMNKTELNKLEELDE